MEWLMFGVIVIGPDTRVNYPLQKALLYIISHHPKLDQLVGYPMVRDMRGRMQRLQLWDLESATPHTQYHLPLSGPVVAPKGSDELWLFFKWAGPVVFHLDFLSHTNSL
jgi:hypothetical protein